MIVLAIFAFLAGLVTILSPCILPILPIILTSSIYGGKARPWGIVAGFVVSFTVFTLTLSTIVRLTGLPSDLLRSISVVILILLGLSMVLPSGQKVIEKLFSYFGRFSLATKKSNGFVGGVIVGLSLGLIWAPCVGPILASIITLAAASDISLGALIITLSYSLGTAIPMLVLIIGGRKLFEKISFVKKYSSRIQQVFGIVMIMLAIGIFLQLDRKLQIFVLDKFPSYGANLTGFENNNLVQKELDKLFEKKADVNDSSELAPGFDGGISWLNSKPLKLEELRGKVVLVDFWTYTCINCIRTLPYLKAWNEKYEKDGLVIIGVHTPEFEFEKNRENVAKALADFGIKYPVVQDNDYVIWNNYSNRYWPAKYLIDKDGRIRYSHFGEGDYDKTERQIQDLLSQTGVSSTGFVKIPEEQNNALTRETYLGYFRPTSFASNEEVDPDRPKTYTFDNLPEGGFALDGTWTVGKEYSMPDVGAKLHLNFDAGKVFLVMRNSNRNGKVRVFLDGKPIPDGLAGADVTNSEATVSTDRLYDLVKLKSAGKHILTLQFLDGSIEVYAFTFG